jgi:uncharacterized protein (TIGR03437 family)
VGRSLCAVLGGVAKIRPFGVYIFAMKKFIGAVLPLLALAPGFARGQSIPIFAGPVINFLPPAVDGTGATVAFGSSVTPQGIVTDTIDLYAGTKKLVPSVTSVGIASDGGQAIFADRMNAAESVGTVNISTGAIRRLSVDTQGCISPLALCVNCFFACVNTPHATSDGKKVLYTVRRNQPFYVVNTDGTGLTQLPIYSGYLAPSPQRVIASNGQVVFTSAAPSGPTFAATATDVYLMNLDGANLRNLTKFGNRPEIFAANATISGDGNTILFESNYAGSATSPPQETQIWAVQADGSNLRLLTFGPDASTAPSISGDGATGVYVQGTVLYIVRPLLPPPPFGRRIPLYPFANSFPQSPVISEDGQRVAFLLGSTNYSPAAVYEVNIDSSNLHPILAPRAISPRGVVSAAGSGGVPSPGGLISIYGINFTNDTVSSAGGFPLPDNLSGLSVVANAKKLPLLNVTPWQINAQLPPEALIQDTNFQVSSTDGTVTPVEVASVAPSSASLFIAPVPLGNGAFSYQVAAFHAGTAIPADKGHPAKSGEALEMYGTGLGATVPPVPAGLPSPGNPAPQARVTPVVRIGNVEARVLFAGLTPGLVGVYQINIVVPDRLAAGQYSVTIKSGDSTLTGAGTLTIQ